MKRVFHLPGICMLIYDHHVHAFGCLSPEDLWGYFLKHGPSRKTSLDWYSKTYRGAFLETPSWEAWILEKDFASFSRFYLCQTPMSFAQFQAKFNIIIALCDLGPESLDLLNLPMERHASEGLRQVEYRFPLPPRFSQFEFESYLDRVSKLLGNVNQKHGCKFTATAAFSLPREIDWYPLHYQWLKGWMKKHPEKSLYFTGIDFSYFEENDEILSKESFFNQVREDNLKDPDLALAILLHVGETFETISAGLSMLRVLEACHLGVHRIGHGHVLGYDFQGQVIRKQSPLINIDSIKSRMAKYGLTWEVISRGQDLVEDAAMLRHLQDEVLRHPGLKKSVFEHCPTSSRLLSGSAKSPFETFFQYEVPTVLCSDDPGIFGTTQKVEIQKIKEMIPKLDVKFQNQFAKTVRSEVLSGKIGVAVELG
jgi:hypothetical protein